MDAPTHIFDKSKPHSPSSVPAAETAVLLQDYQNMIISMAGDAGSSTVSVASALRDWALEQGISVFHCLIDLDSSPHNRSKMAERMGGIGEMLKTNPSMGEHHSYLHPSGKHGEKEMVIKRTPGIVSTLYSKGLEEELKKRNISSLILAGLSSSGCVLSTARDATDRGYVVTVVSDACADRSQDLHNLLMKQTLPMTAHTATLEQVKAAYKA